MYMAYDAGQHALIVLHSDFDHYGPESHTTAELYVIDDGIRKYAFGSEWIKGIKPLPYSPYTFDMKNA